jgi:hypothetical protein
VNVWTKPQTGEAAKAVLVWIYGGGKFFDLLTCRAEITIDRLQHWKLGKSSV